MNKLIKEIKNGNINEEYLLGYYFGAINKMLNDDIKKNPEEKLNKIRKFSNNFIEILKSPSMPRIIDFKRGFYTIQIFIKTLQGKEAEAYKNKLGGPDIYKYAFINEEGEFILNNFFENVSSFNNKGYGGVLIDGKWKFIDKNGNILNYNPNIDEN